MIPYLNKDSHVYTDIEIFGHFHFEICLRKFFNRVKVSHESAKEFQVIKCNSADRKGGESWRL